MTKVAIAPQTISIHVPFRIIKRGGRKEMVLPPEAEARRPRADNTVIKALARAFRWKRMMETGGYATVTELADKEKIAMTYLTRVLRMTLLAPDIVEAILEGRQGENITLTKLADPFPVHWGEQRQHFGMDA